MLNQRYNLPRGGSNIRRKGCLPKDPIIDRAIQELTHEQFQQVIERAWNMKNNLYEGLEVESTKEEDAEGMEPSTSKDKGKGVDPRDWENVKLNAEEIDVDHQCAVLKSFKKQKGNNKEVSEKKKWKGVNKIRYITSNTDASCSDMVEKTHKSHKTRKLAAEVHLVTQILEESYLSAVFIKTS